MPDGYERLRAEPCKGHFIRGRAYGTDLFADCACEGFVEYFEVELEIEAQGAGIEIGRTDIGPAIVDDHQLGMVEGALCPPDAAMTFQHLVELCRHRAVDECQIVDRGHDDVDFDALPRRRHERADQFLVREEIGRHQPDMFFAPSKRRP